MTYDPDNWLVSATRELGAYVTDTIADPDTDVEMSFPDVHSWTKEMPLAKSLIHFEQDDAHAPVLGFGVPAVEIVADDGATVEYQEVAMHELNFDVGVWCSAEAGGATKRMVLTEAIHNIFGSAGGRVALNEATGGLNVVSFTGGGNHLDRVNDLPVWRAMNMTLIVRVFSRHIPAEPEVIALDGVDQSPSLTINVGGSDVPLT